MNLEPARIADDSDFENLKEYIDKHNDWIPQVQKSNIEVWTKTVNGCEFNMIKILSTFKDCTSDIIFDVLHDPDYRRVWDSHMLASEEIGIINVNNDVGYYAMSCPAPLKPRDFVLIRSWLDTGPNGEQMLLSRSITHKDYPPRKGYIRAHSFITGFITRPLSNGDTFLGYVTHCDPQGTLPPWLVNKVTRTVGPQIVKDLRKAAAGYISWTSSQPHHKKPWRYPEQIIARRISLEDCFKATFIENNLNTITPSTSLTKKINSSITEQQEQQQLSQQQQKQQQQQQQQQQQKLVEQEPSEKIVEKHKNSKKFLKKKKSNL